MSRPPENSSGRTIAFFLCLALILGLFLLAVKEMRPEKVLVEIPDYDPWSEEVLAVAREIPVQAGGRVKPFETYADYMMLSMRGDRGMTIRGANGDKVRITPTAWLLDSLFRPDAAMQLPSFRVDNSEVVQLIGLEAREKRDRYSYEEISAAREKLLDLAITYEGMQQREEELDRVQTQTLALARMMRSYEAVLSHLAFARAGIELRGLEPGVAPQRQRVSTVMATADVIRRVLSEAQARGEAPAPHVTDLLQQITQLSNLAKFGLPVLPPPDAETRDWMTAGNRLWSVMTGASGDPEGAVGDIEAMEELVAAEGEDPAKFAAVLDAWRGDIEKRARARGEYRSIPLELGYNRANWFFNALFFCFLPGSLFLALGLLSPGGRWGRTMRRLVWVFSIAGLVLTIAGITHRAIIMERPPVGNLFDTIPFIAAGIVLVALLAEAMTRRGFALGIAPVMGLLGLVLARRYEFSEGVDTMDPLIAVLRSNFWLTTHVLTITAGYAAGLLTAGVGLVYVLRRVLGMDGGDKSMRRALTRMTYGCIGFTLVFSLIGTVLGGIWANYSWGRFWGWDPKENGALLIVLWNLFILHARLGGYLKEWGVNLAAVFGAIVVTFSWWHVNLLGVGLHSYGFSDSKKMLVFAFYGVISIVLLVGIGFMYYEKASKRATPADPLGGTGAPVPAK
jgi:ABC-type transport system involved in cytochrome c biogenesis permease subunit